ncbi:uncharacterized protein CBL_12290 [Carabus blaptoides fortunei]
MNRPILIPFDNNFEIIHITSDEFSVGRGLTNSFVFKELCISRCHCVFKYNGTSWILTDKSSNGTTINSLTLGKNASGSIEHNDIIAFTENIKYRVQYSPESHEQNSNKRKRIDNSSHENLVPKKISPLENRNQNSDAQKATEIKDKITDSCSKSGINLLTDELKREKAVNKILKEESTAMQDKIMGLQVDLFNKISANVSLEHENAELKVDCATLEKEKEELQLQLTDYENQTFVLKSRLQNSQSTNTNVRETDAVSDEDKKLLTCVLRVEIMDKECTVKTKLSNVLVRLKALQTQTNDSNSINIIREHLQEIQESIDDMIIKRSELNSISRTADGPSDDTDEIKEKFYYLMESELQCSICNEIFVKATTLNCNHTFCKTCIARWRKQKNSCPICRVPVQTSTQCIAVDNYIDQTMDSMAPSKKELRTKLKETYEASASGPSTTNATVNRTATIVLSSDDSDSDTDIDSEDYSEYSETENYHGGYGSCFICGNPSHWANSCPRRRRRY